VNGPAQTRSPRCPTCRTPVTWQGNAQRPFCSLTCRLIDLGDWLDERYRITGHDTESSESAAEDRQPSAGG